MRSKVLCLEAALVDIKERYSDPTRLLNVRSSIISSLNETVQTMGQTLSDIMFESNIREHKLSESNGKLAKLIAALSISQSTNDMSKRCIERGDVLLIQHQNSIQELLVERQSRIQTIEQCNSLQFSESYMINSTSIQRNLQKQILLILQQFEQFKSAYEETFCEHAIWDRSYGIAWF